MLDQKLKDKIEVFLISDYIEILSGEFELWEKSDDGRTRLKVGLLSDESILCIRDHDHQPRCAFLNPDRKYGLMKSVDHIVLTPNDNDTWTAHLIEMKSGVGESEWNDIRAKVRASILNMRACAAVLDITISLFKIYTTYERLSYKVDDPTNLTGRKPRLGGGWKENEWDKNQVFIYVPKGKKEFLWHNGIKMKKEIVEGKDTLCGEVTLS